MRVAGVLVLVCSLCALAGCSLDLDEDPAVSSSSRPIVNGEATIDFPTTGILLTGGNPARLMCSGTLIGCDRFLTAAHCVCSGQGGDCQSPSPEDTLRVYLQNVGFLSVTRRHVHPDYAFPDNDVAVLELGQPASGVAPTPLPSSDVALGTSGTIVGYGRSGGGQEDYGIKQFGPIVTTSCPVDAGDPNHLCWNYQGDGSNTCNGDSGGPLFVQQGGELVVAGTTSGGTREDCLSGDHSYDNDIFAFRDFIVASAGGAARLGQARCGDLPQVDEQGAAVMSSQGRLEVGQSAELQVQVPIGTAELRVALNSTDGADLDLFVRRGAEPSATESDCSAVGPSSYGFCGVTAPQSGTWYVTATAADAADYQVTITVLAGAPGATDDTYTGAADEALEVGAADGVLANDQPTERGPLAAQIATQPVHGTVELAADGGFVYQPAPGFLGADSFTYHASDGSVAATASVQVTIAPPDPDDGGGGGCAAGRGGAGSRSALLLAAIALLAAVRPRRAG